MKGMILKMDDIRKAMAEVNTVLKYSSVDIKNRVPTNFIELLEKYQDDTYKLEIDVNKNLNEQNLMPETKEILALIYRDYLCDSTEREKLIENNKKKLEIINSKYDIENVFEKKREKRITPKEQYPVKIQKKWYKKLFSFFMKIFNNR